MSSFNDCRFVHVFQSDCFLQGPAGTGKTESVKALGNQLGRFVLVFNCDENFDFQVSIINDMKYVIQNSNFRAPLHVHLCLFSTKLCIFLSGHGSYLCGAVSGGSLGLLR